MLLPTSFRPTKIAGCTLWLKSDAITGLADGDPIATWPDYSGNGYDATQATAAKKPTFKTNIQNGRPVVRFDAVDDWMGVSNSALPATAMTVLCVAKITNNGGMVLSRGYNTAGFYLAKGAAFAITQSGDGVGGGEVTSTGTTNITSAWAVITAVIGSNVQTLFVNAAQEDSDAVEALAYSAADAVAVGTQRSSVDDVSGLLNGDIGEIIVYNSALSTANRGRVERYLARRWGITLA